MLFLSLECNSRLRNRFGTPASSDASLAQVDVCLIQGCVWFYLTGAPACYMRMSKAVRRCSGFFGVPQHRDVSLLRSFCCNIRAFPFPRGC